MEQRKRNRGLKDLSGRTYGRLKILELVERDFENNNHVYRMSCECGSIVEKRIRAVAYGKTVRSCGCLAKETLIKRNTTHGLSRVMPAEYKIWKDMWARCSNPKRSDWKWYGGRGIGVDERWEDFAAFAQDMGSRPEGMTIDRIDSNKGYGPGNCRWATLVQQANNRGSNHRISVDGQSMTLAEAAGATGVPATRIRARLKLGMPEDKAVSQDDFRSNR